MSRKFYFLSAIIFTILVIGACSSTKIIGSWKNADFGEKTYGKIMIAALTPNVVAKGAVEADVAEKLQARGVNAKGAGGVFNPEMEITEEIKKQISTTLLSEGYDGILTFTLVSQDEKTNYVPGTTYTYAPYAYGYGGSYWGYYGYYAPQVYEPGYYTTSQVYLIEAILYDLQTEKMVWAARSEATDPSSIESFASDFSSTIVYQLQKDRMLK